ncbi:Holliday junction resolvase [Pseudomonas sp. TTU2014-105ASC]|nr:Holliday junction resolvase [Pseudomonas sp. TTU2014-105ASC]
MRSFSTALLVLACTATQAHAIDVTIASVVQSSYVSSQLTSAPFDDKLIAEARDDAAGFVASGGQFVAARLQAAMSRLRQEHPELATSDLELAEAILAQ